MKRLFLLALLSLVWIVLGSLSLNAQFLPASSHAAFFLAHLADGGPQSDKWTTVFRIVNPDWLTKRPGSGTLWFFDPQGNPLPLDFGNGAVTTLQVNIASQGATQLITRGASSVLRTGSVVGQFDSPVLVVEEFQNWRNGVFVNGASVNGTGVNFAFKTYADRYTGVAVSNPDPATIYCSGTLKDANGNVLGSNSITLPAWGQVSFTLGNTFNLTSSSSYSYNMTCDWQQNAAPNSPQPAPFGALAIAGNSKGITSSMPPGGFALPSDTTGMIRDAFYQLKKALNSQPGFEVGQVNLQILGNPNINANYDPTTNSVNVELALVELLADSPSEVASVIAHELGHAHQAIVGSQFYPGNLEHDADLFSLWGLLFTGYDAYAAGGALGKLAMATGRSSIFAQQFDNLNIADLHSSFTARIDLIMNEIQTLCGSASGAKLCQLEKSIFHPHLPSSPFTPLLKKAATEGTTPP